MNPDGDLVARVCAHYYRYARAVDDGDVDAISDLVADEVCVVRGPDEFRGRAHVLSLYRAHGEVPGQLSHHVITNVQATRQADGTVAAGAYVTVTMVDADGGVRLLLGRYTDRLADDGGELRLVHKHVDVRRELHLAATVRTFTGVEVSEPSPYLT